MTDLERRALLGDKQAQEECTRQEILLSCPFCGGAAMIEYDVIMPFEYSVFCGDCGVMPSTSEDKQVAVLAWNTRPAPPIGRCKDCKHAGEFGEWSFAICKKKSEHHNFTVKRDDSCNYFEPRHPDAT